MEPLVNRRSKLILSGFKKESLPLPGKVTISWCSKGLAGRRFPADETIKQLFCFEGRELIELAQGDLFGKRVVGKGGALFLA
jgi:hypothetical protein